MYQQKNKIGQNDNQPTHMQEQIEGHFYILLNRDALSLKTRQIPSRENILKNLAKQQKQKKIQWLFFGKINPYFCSELIYNKLTKGQTNVLQ